jgi:hypothetical protein
MKVISIIILVLMSAAAGYAAAQAPNDPWTALPSTTAHDLTVTFRAVLISSDALGWPDGRSALITYWRGGPSDAYYRCVDYKDANFQSTGHACWQLEAP